MNEDNHDEIASEIIEGIKQNFPRAKSKSFEKDDDLFEQGIIDSLGFLTVVSFIEREFNISVRDEDIIPENFSSVDQMTHYIQEKQAKHTSPVY